MTDKIIPHTRADDTGFAVESAKYLESEVTDRSYIFCHNSWRLTSSAGLNLRPASCSHLSLLLCLMAAEFNIQLVSFVYFLFLPSDNSASIEVVLLEVNVTVSRDSFHLWEDDEENRRNKEKRERRRRKSYLGSSQPPGSWWSLQTEPWNIRVCHD